MASRQSSLDPIKLAMKATNDLFKTEVVAKRNFDALDDICTADACVLPPGGPMVSGRKAVREFYPSRLASMHIKSVALSSIQIIQSGDGMVEIGAAELTVEPPGKSASVVHNKYVIYWQQEDGRWKWRVEIWNATD
jgi:ketosteroid isomerase-like protein